jgi:uncharacterized protein with HEPN domain
MKNDKININSIADCICQIQNYTQEGQTSFTQTRMIQDAVIRDFQVMGEATKNLSTEFKSAYSDMPWRKIAGFRDVLRHSYISLDLAFVWEVIETDLPELKPKIEAIVQELGGIVR